MIVSSSELMPVIRAALKRGQRVHLTASGSSMWPSVPRLRHACRMALRHGVRRIRDMKTERSDGRSASGTSVRLGWQVRNDDD